MVERREKLRFPLEPSQSFDVARERFGQNFDGDIAIEFRVTGAVDLTHTPFSDGR